MRQIIQGEASCVHQFYARLQGNGDQRSIQHVPVAPVVAAHLHPKTSLSSLPSRAARFQSRLTAYGCSFGLCPQCYYSPDGISESSMAESHHHIDKGQEGPPQNLLVWWSHLCRRGVRRKRQQTKPSSYVCC